MTAQKSSGERFMLLLNAKGNTDLGYWVAAGGDAQRQTFAASSYITITEDGFTFTKGTFDTASYICVK